MCVGVPPIEHGNAMEGPDVHDLSREDILSPCRRQSRFFGWQMLYTVAQRVTSLIPMRITQIVRMQACTPGILSEPNTLNSNQRLRGLLVVLVGGILRWIMVLIECVLLFAMPGSVGYQPLSQYNTHVRVCHCAS